MQFKYRPPMDMMPTYLRKLLKSPPHLLKSFHYEDVLAFLQMGEEQRFVSHDLVFDQSDYITSAFLVADGKVTVWNDNIELANLGAGSFLGETFLFSKHTRMAKVTAHNDCILLKFERYDVLNYFRRRPEKLFNIFTKNIIEIQQDKIQNMNVQLLQLKKRLLDERKF